MPSFISKMKQKILTKKGDDLHNNQAKEQSVTIQPHPAKTNDPADLNREPPQLGGGLNTNPELQAHHAKPPYVPNQEIVNSLEQPQSREELRARQAELNK